MKHVADKVRAHARALSRLGASKGGAARAASLSQERRAEIARAGAGARWKKQRLLSWLGGVVESPAVQERPYQKLSFEDRLFHIRSLSRALLEMAELRASWNEKVPEADPLPQSSIAALARLRARRPLR